MASTYERVSLTSSGMQADGESSLAEQSGYANDPAVSPTVFSADGSGIVFQTNAMDITGDGSGQAVLKNLASGADTLETGGSDTIQGATSVAFTPDGKTLLIEGFASGGGQIYEQTPTGGAPVLVSSDATGAAGNGTSSLLAVSTDGSRVAFTSSASNLVPGATSGEFVKDLGTGGIVQLGDGSTDTVSSGDFSFAPDLSEAVYTDDANADNGPPPEVYAENLTTGAKTLLSGTAGVAADKGGFGGIVLSGGNRAAFTSESTNLVAGAPSGGIFVTNLTTGTTSTVVANQITTSGTDTSGTGYELLAASPTTNDLAYVAVTGDVVNNADGSNHGTDTSQIDVTDLASGATVAVTPSGTTTFTGGPSSTTDPGYESPFGPMGDSQTGTLDGTSYSGAVFSPDGTKIAYSAVTYTNYSYDFTTTPAKQSGTLTSQVFVYDTQTGTSTPVTAQATFTPGSGSGSYYGTPQFSPNSQEVAVEHDTIGEPGSTTLVTNLASGAQTSVPVGIDQVFFAPNGDVAFTSSDALATDDTNGESDVYTAAPVCFVSGTRIATTRGEVAVEDLAVGDVAVTVSGAQRSIAWLGHRTIDCRRHKDRAAVLPVRIAAHALGANRPARDLVVSPCHAICVDVAGEVLIPAIALVDGVGIVQLDVARVTYWHVELEGGHDILLAENLPAESYLEMGNRGFFAEAEAVALHARPDAPVATHDDFCRPFVDGGPLLDAVRARLSGRSRAAIPRRRAVG